MDEDEMLEAYAASQSSEPVVLESKEVVGQRIRDLCEFVKGTLPTLFSGATQAPLHKKELMMVLQELDQEFGYSQLHRMSLMSLMAVKISKVVSPAADSAAVSEMNRMDPSSEEVEEMMEEDGSIHGSLEILWDTLLPDLSGDLGQLMDLAGIPVTCTLNSFLWEDPSWDTVAENLIDSLDPVLELFVGMVGFNMLIIYIQIMDNKSLPKMTYHIHS